MDLSDAIRTQAAACGRLGSPMYDILLSRVAHDVEGAGVSAALLAGHESDPGPSGLALRLMGSVHRLVLERRAPELAAYFPSVGGRFEAGGCWDALRRLFADEPAAVTEWLDRPPQTNEVGRASALFGGALQLPWRWPIRLFEIGSSGGLNLNADVFEYVDEAGRHFGVDHSPVLLAPAWRGRQLAAWSPEFLERVGSDLRHVDASTAEGRLTLSAYVWPDQAARWRRLRGGLAVARRRPVEVLTATARDFVASISLRAGYTTLLWHSVMWQYLDPDEQRDVTASCEALGAVATAETPFAWLFLEPWRRTPGSEHEFLVILQTWPTGERRILGTSKGHGSTRPEGRGKVERHRSTKGAR